MSVPSKPDNIYKATVKKLVDHILLEKGINVLNTPGLGVDRVLAGEFNDPKLKELLEEITGKVAYTSENDLPLRDRVITDFAKLAAYGGVTLVKGQSPTGFDASPLEAHYKGDTGDMWEVIKEVAPIPSPTTAIPTTTVAAATPIAAATPPPTPIPEPSALTAPPTGGGLDSSPVRIVDPIAPPSTSVTTAASVVVGEDSSPFVGMTNEATAVIAPLSAQELYERGVKYFSGEGVTVDKREAVRCFELSANQGNMYAQYELGYCYSAGELVSGVPKDLVKAAEYYKLSADNGLVSAKFSLAKCYDFGLGVPENKAEAIKLYKEIPSDYQNYSTVQKSLERLGAAPTPITVPSPKTVPTEAEKQALKNQVREAAEANARRVKQAELERHRAKAEKDRAREARDREASAREIREQLERERTAALNAPKSEALTSVLSKVVADVPPTAPVPPIPPVQVEQPPPSQPVPKAASTSPPTATPTIATGASTVKQPTLSSDLDKWSKSFETWKTAWRKKEKDPKVWLEASEAVLNGEFERINKAYPIKDVLSQLKAAETKLEELKLQEKDLEGTEDIDRNEMEAAVQARSQQAMLVTDLRKMVDKYNSVLENANIIKGVIVARERASEAQSLIAKAGPGPRSKELEKALGNMESARTGILGGPKSYLKSSGELNEKIKAFKSSLSASAATVASTSPLSTASSPSAAVAKPVSLVPELETLKKLRDDVGDLNSSLTPFMPTMAKTNDEIKSHRKICDDLNKRLGALTASLPTPWSEDTRTEIDNMARRIVKIDLRIKVYEGLFNSPNPPVNAMGKIFIDRESLPREPLPGSVTVTPGQGASLISTATATAAATATATATATAAPTVESASATPADATKSTLPPLPPLGSIPTFTLPPLPPLQPIPPLSSPPLQPTIQTVGPTAPKTDASALAATGPETIAAASAAMGTTAPPLSTLVTDSAPPSSLPPTHASTTDASATAPTGVSTAATEPEPAANVWEQIELGPVEPELDLTSPSTEPKAPQTAAVQSATPDTTVAASGLTSATATATAAPLSQPGTSVAAVTTPVSASEALGPDVTIAQPPKATAAVSAKVKGEKREIEAVIVDVDKLKRVIDLSYNNPKTNESSLIVFQNRVEKLKNEVEGLVYKGGKSKIKNSRNQKRVSNTLNKLNQINRELQENLEKIRVKAVEATVTVQSPPSAATTEAVAGAPVAKGSALADATQHALNVAATALTDPAEALYIQSMNLFKMLEKAQPKSRVKILETIIDRLKQADKLGHINAETQLARANRELGICYRDGLGVAPDSDKAAEYLRVADKLGDPFAKQELAPIEREAQELRELEERMGMHGPSTPVTAQSVGLDRTIASATAATAAASIPNPNAQTLADPAAALQPPRTGDPATAIATHSEPSPLSPPLPSSAPPPLPAAAGLTIEELNALGKRYAEGLDGVNQDWKEAAKYFQQSADKGDKNAQCELAVCYINGQGVEKNTAKGLQLLQQSSTPKALCNLGICYEYGIGVPLDLNRALDYYRNSAESGHQLAIERRNALAAKLNVPLNVAIPPSPGPLQPLTFKAVGTTGPQPSALNALQSGAPASGLPDPSAPPPPPPPPPKSTPVSLQPRPPEGEPPPYPPVGEAADAENDDAALTAAAAHSAGLAGRLSAAGSTLASHQTSGNNTQQAHEEDAFKRTAGQVRSRTMDIDDKLRHNDLDDLDAVMKQIAGSSNPNQDQYYKIGNEITKAVSDYQKYLDLPDVDQDEDVREDMENKLSAHASWIESVERIESMKKEARVKLKEANADKERGLTFFDQATQMKLEAKIEQINKIEKQLANIEKELLATKGIFTKESDWEAKKGVELTDKLTKINADLNHEKLKPLIPKKSDRAGFKITPFLAQQLKEKHKLTATAEFETHDDYLEKSDKSIQRVKDALYKHNRTLTTKEPRDRYLGIGSKEDTARRASEREELYKGVCYKEEPKGNIEVTLPEGASIKRSYDPKNRKTNISVDPPEDRAILIMLDTCQGFKKLDIKIPLMPNGKPAEKADINEDDMRNVLKAAAAAKLREDKPPVTLSPDYMKILKEKFPAFEENFKAIQELEPQKLDKLINPVNDIGEKEPQTFTLDELVDGITRGTPLNAHRTVAVQIAKAPRPGGGGGDPDN